MRQAILKLLSPGEPKTFAEARAQASTLKTELEAAKRALAAEQKRAERAEAAIEKKQTEVAMLQKQIDMFAAQVDVYMRRLHREAVIESIRSGRGST